MLNSKQIVVIVMCALLFMVSCMPEQPERPEHPEREVIWYETEVELTFKDSSVDTLMLKK